MRLKYRLTTAGAFLQIFHLVAKLAFSRIPVPDGASLSPRFTMWKLRGQPMGWLAAGAD